jgi:hypothetical protein
MLRRMEPSAVSASTSGDRDRTAQQVREFAVFDEAHRAAAGTSAGVGLVFLGLGLAFPAMKAIAGVAHGTSTAPGFVQRMADMPIWVVVLMTICGGVLGFFGVRSWWRLRASSAPTTAYLRANPDDPVVDAQAQVLVKRGYRSATFFFTTRRGHQLREVVSGAFEARAQAAITASVPIAHG